jgi:predicted CopG family antitoxin
MVNTNNIADKRIPVTEHIWGMLHDMRKPGQTYSDLIAEMMMVYNKKKMKELEGGGE